VGPGAEFVAHDEGPAGRRDYIIGPTSASLSVNGSAVPIGAEHRDWIGMMILEYVRRTGLDATGRSRAIVTTGGVSAILDEARKISGKDVRVKYLEAAFPSVAADRRPAFVRDAASLLDSASARAEFLFAIPRDWLADEGVLAAVYAEAGVIEPTRTSSDCSATRRRQGRSRDVQAAGRTVDRVASEYRSPHRAARLLSGCQAVIDSALWRDVRHALRVARLNAGFSSMVALTIARRHRIDTDDVQRGRPAVVARAGARRQTRARRTCLPDGARARTSRTDIEHGWICGVHRASRRAHF
jgi:hypothetical protein